MAAITQPHAYFPLSGRRYSSFAGKTETLIVDIEMESRRHFVPHREGSGHQSHFPRASSSFGFSILRPSRAALGV